MTGRTAGADHRSDSETKQQKEIIHPMAYQHDDDLHLTYDSRRGYWHFVLYIEPPAGAGSAINASQSFKKSTSSYAGEWLSRLIQCEADALHVSLVRPHDAPKLWDPCVYEDHKSPSAVAGSGCLCWKTFRDSVTLLPAVAHHYRTASGDIDEWTYFTYAPLSLPDSDRLDRLVIDREADMFWVRTDRGTLHILPEKQGAGYGTGYGGGGPSELARMIEKIIKSDGYDVSAGTEHKPSGAKVYSWTRSVAADRTQELTLDQLKLLDRGGSDLTSS
jgi:hypothetical protein